MDPTGVPTVCFIGNIKYDVTINGQQYQWSLHGLREWRSIMVIDIYRRHCRFQAACLRGSTTIDF
eukprot:COSAG01_NODE_10521_length_2144_cov_4.710513_4_plen_65_part_00